MTLIPAFIIGLWNAWIFMLAFAIGHALPSLLWMRISESLKKRTWPADVYLNKTEKIIGTLPMPIIGLLLIYSIFLPLPLGTAWFYIGLIIFLLGLIIYMMPSKGILDVPPDKPFTGGPYRYSRHPIYLTMVLELIGQLSSDNSVSYSCKMWLKTAFRINDPYLASLRLCKLELKEYAL